MTKIYNNVINFKYIDYIIKKYIPKIMYDKKMNNIDMGIFRESMCHISTKTEKNNKSYERLEFLGDAVFHLAITEYFYKRYDEENEGFLTRLRIKIERGESMVELTKIIGLDKFIRISDVAINDHILEDIFEAFIGAFYINFGIEYTSLFIINLIETHKSISKIIHHDDNYKDILLRYFHKMKWGHPVYNEIHNNMNNKKFVIVVKNPDNKIIGKGAALSKKKAEQYASKNALERLGIIIDGEIDIDIINKMEKNEEDNIKEQKEQNAKKKISFFNESNKLISNGDIRDVLKKYNTFIPRTFRFNIKLFFEATTHNSYLRKKKYTAEMKELSKKIVKPQLKSNERLQFLGDAVIHFIATDYIYNRYPDADEGFMTRLRCKLENRESLFSLAKKTDISSFILVSSYIELIHGRNNINIIGGGFEAFVGALFLDVGISKTNNFFLEIIRTELNIDKIAEQETNYKDIILRIYAANHWGTPKYIVEEEYGPDHKKIFIMGIYIDNHLIGLGKAHSKKKAEQIASKNMYNRLLKLSNQQD